MSDLATRDAGADGTCSETVIGRPPPHLARFVDSYVGYRLEGFPPGIHAGLPSRSLTLVVSFGSPVDMVVMPDSTQRPDALFALAGGLCNAPVMIRHDGNQHGIQLGITPLGARALFGMPAAELAWVVVDLEDVLGAAARGLSDRLSTAPSWGARFAALDVVLSDAFREPARIRPEVIHAWNQLAMTAGAVGVGELAEEVGWSRRHLSGQFRAEIGLSPKTMGRIMRFERAKAMVCAPGAPSLAEVAARCGYADQAHMNRDWREMAGSSPSQWMAEEFPFVQDDTVDHGAH